MTGSTPPFDPQAAVRSERLALAELLSGLDGDDWDRPSLCDGWTVAEVVAHLTLSTTETWTDLLVGMLRHRGFDRQNAARAREHAARHLPPELIEQLRAAADDTRHGPGSSTLDQLVDLLVHRQDITRPIGRPPDVPTMPGIAALEHALDSRWYGARRRVAGLRLRAVDAEWSRGGGELVEGPLSALLLVATGREAGVADLDGPGLATLTGRMSRG